MTDPSEKQQEPEELDLDAETVADLAPDKQDTEEVIGGHKGASGQAACA